MFRAFKYGVLIFAIVALVVLIFFRPESNTPRVQKVMTIGGMELRVDVADTHETRVRGLSGRKSMAPDEGLLFIFNTPGEYGIWMKDMYFPIDVLWLNSELEVVHIVEEMQPDSYPTSYRTNTPAQYVLEINAGLVNREGVSIGDQATVK